jgi:putative endonuclease
MSLLLKLRLRLMEGSLAVIDRFLHISGQIRPIPHHLRVGRLGEDAAFFHLRRKGYTVVARSWKSLRHRGDLDLIAWEGETLCFVEVKTRTSREVATAEAAVDKEKRRVIRRLASDYLRSTSRPPVRFDIVSVYLDREGAPEIIHFPGAFGWSDFKERW